MTPGSSPGSVISMPNPTVLPLPGNSDREGNFYEQQRPAGPAITTPTGNAGWAEPLVPAAPKADPSPFKIEGDR